MRASKSLLQSLRPHGFRYQIIIHKVISLLKRDKADARDMGSPERLGYFFVDHPKERCIAQQEKIPLNIIFNVQLDRTNTFQSYLQS